MAYQYYKNLCLEKSLLSDFEEPDANFHQLLLPHPTFHKFARIGYVTEDGAYFLCLFFWRLILSEWIKYVLYLGV